MPDVNYASKYSRKVDERFYRESQAALGVNNDYRFSGAKTVVIYSIPTVALTDYSRTGTNRYGTPADLRNNVQEMTVTRDRAFTFIIDRGDKTQTMMVMDAGRALAREIHEVVVPEYDTYIFNKLARTAFTNGNTSATAITKENAYECFLKAQETLGDAATPDNGRVCFCSYKFANLLKQDPAFMRYGDNSQNMLSRGILGEVDGCRIVKIPASRLPNNCSFILTHPSAATAPKQLEEYKIHANPPGISGWLVEGRLLYDCFILNQKVNAIYYHGAAFSGS